jgi:hypothetical protein
MWRSNSSQEDTHYNTKYRIICRGQLSSSPRGSERVSWDAVKCRMIAVMRTIFVAVLLTLFALPVSAAQPVPQLSGHVCPLHFHPGGGAYCIPSSAGAPQAIVRQPYTLASRLMAESAISPSAGKHPDAKHAARAKDAPRWLEHGPRDDEGAAYARLGTFCL